MSDVLALPYPDEAAWYAPDPGYLYLSPWSSAFDAEYEFLLEEFPNAPRGKLAALALYAEEVARPVDAPSILAYLEREGIDTQAVRELAGPFVLQQVRFEALGLFSFAIDGEPALVCAVHGEDAETPIDLVAWSASNPARFATYFGDAGVLGADQVINPASYSGGSVSRRGRISQEYVGQCHFALISMGDTGPIHEEQP